MKLNDGRHMHYIIDATSCPRGHAPQGSPCFHLPKSDGGGYYSGICNSRVLKIGFNGVVSETSYMRTAISNQPQPSLEEMKLLLTKANSGPSWAAKVKNMNEIQTAAVYLRMKKKGQIK